MSDMKNIQEIIDGCVAKNARYQRMLVDKYSNLLYAICVRYMKDKEFARDMLQESLLKILNHIDRFDSELGSITTWMKTITIRTCLKRLDKKRVDLVAMEDHNTYDKGFDPSILDQLNNQELVKIIQSLPEGYAEVFNMAVIDGYNHEEIGHFLGIKPSSSRSRLSRAKQLLRVKITELKLYESWVNTA